ncbi:hypothetical protein GCM10007868_18710 [Gluconobacter frateurii]|uniref:Uncharacterized protein n=1 Tax=Gluconobacter frateurii NRIC 0228 TaxID=1307946 RepID=A0ABQ0Q8T3_9PROT|nr:hypothetical protein AA0228_0631 [Gluconobacter frateurii NRIC 0228]GLP90796.1 hypothetical protein GCM10007868_18710 [Gluconobacter frateurii]
MCEALHDLGDATDNEKDAEEDHAGQRRGDRIEGGEQAQNDEDSADANEPAGLEV